MNSPSFQQAMLGPIAYDVQAALYLLALHRFAARAAGLGL
jgi:hypothetical protein